MALHEVRPIQHLADVMAADQWARDCALAQPETGHERVNL